MGSYTEVSDDRMPAVGSYQQIYQVAGSGLLYVSRCIKRLGCLQLAPPGLQWVQNCTGCLSAGSYVYIASAFVCATCMQGQELHFGTGCSLAAQAFGVILLGSVFEAMMLLQVLMAFLLGMLGQGGPLEEALLRLLEQQATQTQLLLMMQQQQQQQLQHQQQMQQLLPPPAVLPQPTFPAFPFPPPRPFTIGVPGVPVQPPTLPAGVPAQPAAICSMPAAGAELCEETDSEIDPSAPGWFHCPKPKKAEAQMTLNPKPYIPISPKP